ncbi:MAG: biosynthetic-type acetolactate synthase large subunit [Coriobacteriales bacterium]|nr:biosynthetic-type acetolactate synthase large subunit [Coriobacteriaceae bacterium]MDY2722205.1 biosynthetic-type acetolactate synthase large subunit [Coriobacteriales bacterium]
MTGAQCLIKALEDVGVDTIFGYPGGQAIDIYNALYDSKKLHHILVRHEQGAAHAADGYARATGKVGTVIVTSGPGATNTVTGISTAYMDSIPMVVITGQVATSSLGSDAFQESDMTGITMPIVKHSYLVHDPKDLPEIIAEAYYIASTGRPGPVVIDVPGNVSKAQNVPYHFPEEVKLESYKPTYKGNSKQVKSAVRALEKAERPIIYAGGGILSSNASAELLDLAETLQIPVVVSLIGKSCMPEDNPLCLGMPGMHGSRAANAALQNSDLIFAVGTRFADRVTGRLSAFAPDAKVIHVDIDPAEIGKNRNADIPVVGDAKLVLAAINEQLHKDQAQPVDAEWVAKIDAIRRESPFYYEKRDDAIQPEYALELLDKLTKDKDTIFTTEVGQHQMWAAQYLHCTRPRTFLSSGGAGTMGFGFPAAIGAQEGCPDSLVVCVAGDGSLQMNIQEMATAYEAGTPVKVLLLNNSTLGMVHQWQDLFYSKRFSQTVFTGNPDFVKLAQAYHWYGDSVSDPAQLEGAMEKWLSQEGPALLEVIIPEDENVFPMVPAGGTLTGQIGVVKLDESGHPVEKKGK